MAVEAFVSERAAYHLEEERISELVWQKVSRGDAKIFTRLNMLVREFNQVGLDWHPHYERLQAMVAVRNCLVHRKAQYLTTAEWPDEVEKKHRRHMPELDGAGWLDWTARALHAEMASWAVDVASEMMDEAAVYVPGHAGRRREGDS